MEVETSEKDVLKKTQQLYVGHSAYEIYSRINDIPDQSTAGSLWGIMEKDRCSWRPALSKNGSKEE